MAPADRARARMVAALRARGRLRDAAVEDAFAAVPRHLFLPGVSPERAYADEAVAVQHVDGVATSSASQPSMMAIMLDQLDLRAGHRVLEIGAGTGYNAALMARIVGPAGSVVSVDIDRELVDSAARHLAAAGTTTVELHCADGAFGHPAGAPYDRIVLTVGSSDVRPEWIAQLAPGGRLLLPLALRGSQLSVPLDLADDGLLRSASAQGCAFIRLRGAGADGDAAIGTTGGGLAVQPAAESADPDRVAALLDAALTAPGPTRPGGAHLGPLDLWDGFGLWLALAEPAACRVLTAEADPAPADVAAALFPAGPGRGTVALLANPLPALRSPTAAEDALGEQCGSDVPDGGGGDPATAAGAAMVVLDAAAHDDRPGPWPVAVRAFGADGPAAAERLVAALGAWRSAGRPTAADLHLVVVPRDVDAPPPEPGTPVVEKEHCSVRAYWR